MNELTTIPQLSFLVTNQTIKKTKSFYVVAKSQNYLYAHFDFGTPEWEGLTKTAIFSTAGQSYQVLLDEDGNCLVPWEALAQPGVDMRVSVTGGDLITVNTAPVRIHETGYTEDAQEGREPSPSLYDQIMEEIEKLKQQGIDEDTIREAISEYLSEHPVEESDPTVPSWAKAPTKPTYTAQEIGALSETSLDDAINTALAAAKESGEFDGAKGDKGDPGEKGDAGAKGERGDTGEKGDTGEAGTGIASTVLNADYTLTITLTDGASYTTPSIRGVQGIQGVQGEAGAKGDKGDPGIQGPKGDPGEKGEKGDTGEQGPRGEQGPQGPKGNDGYTPVKGVDYFYGQPGDTGEAGNGIASTVLNADYTLTLTFTDGTSYITPSIRGGQGIQGIQGPKGEKGDTGEQGAQGPKGDTGEKGDPGEKGPKGDTGDPGYTPVRGTDYWTAADKAEIVADVLAEFIDLAEVAQ